MAEEFSAQAQQLASTVSFFKLEEAGAEPSATKAAEPPRKARPEAAQAPRSLPPARERPTERVTSIAIKASPSDKDEDFEEF